MLPVELPGADLPPTVDRGTSIRPDLLMIAVGFLAVVAIAWFALLDRTDERGEDELASVAVYPFECLQDVRGQEGHLCYGFAEETISALKQVDGMQIVRKRTNFDSLASLAEDSLVTGSVQIIADQVKIAAQLEDRSGVVVWSQTFNDHKGAIFELQGTVANAVRAALDKDFRPQPADARPPVSYAVKEATALGRYLFEQRENASIAEAIRHFEEAIRLDPTYGPAWLGLAYTYSIWPDYDLAINRQETFDKALAVIEEGVAADPSIREAAGTVYGYVYLKRYQWQDAMANTLGAVSREAPEGDDFHWHSRVLASVGRLDESLEFARRGAEMDPDNPALMSRMAMASLWVNDRATAERYFTFTNQMKFRAPIHGLAYSLFLIREDRIEEAKDWTRIALNELKVDSAWVDPLFDGFANPARKDTALQVLDQLQAFGGVPANVIITASVLLGETDRAMAVARGPDLARDAFDIEIIYLDEFRAFRQHPEFVEFTADVGLSDYWASAGCEWRDDRVVCSD
jgi:TolB-like protein/Tfp pilus assembly protein PilF